MFKAGAAISILPALMNCAIASLRSQRRLLGLFTNASHIYAFPVYADTNICLIHYYVNAGNGVFQVKLPDNFLANQLSLSCVLRQQALVEHPADREGQSENNEPDGSDKKHFILKILSIQLSCQKKVLFFYFLNN